MDNAKIALVTGATGFIGGHLVRRLIDDGWQVRAVSSGTKKRSQIADIAHLIDWYDLENCNVIQAVSGITHFFNFAVVYDRDEFCSETIERVNVILPYKFLSTIAGLDPSVICILGDTFYRKFPVDATRQPRYTYSKHKLSNRVKCELGSLNRVAFLLVEQVYGSGESLNKVYSRIAQQLLEKVPRINLTKGTQCRDFIYIDDVIDAVMLITCSDWAGVVDVECGSGIATPVKDAFSLMREIARSTSYLGFGDLESDQAIDVSYADLQWLNKLGWRSKVSLDEGMAKFIDDIKLRLKMVAD